MKKLIAVAAVFVSMTAFAGDKLQKPALQIRQPEVKWSQPYGPQGPSFGFVVGTFGTKTPVSFFIKFPAGSDSGWHTHDEDYESVVLKGTMTAQQQGEGVETSLPVGAYFTQPGKQNHRNGCSKDAECLIFVRFDRGASTHPMTPDGKLVAMPTPDKAAK